MKTNTFSFISIFSFLQLYVCIGFSQINTHTQALFQKKDVLHVTIETNMRALLKDRGKTSIYHWCKLTYTDEEGHAIILPVKVKTRGNFRRDASNCSLPPLSINFPNKKTKNTLFEGQEKLKFVNKCKDYEHLLYEYLAYEIYNLVTDYSFKARLVEVTYLDSLNRRKPETTYGFFIENDNQLAQRHEAKILSRQNIAMANLDSLETATFVMFQYMIGNNDWSLPYLHNMILLFNANKRIIPVAYDFDFAGIAETNYATPPKELEIVSVRERLYRGLNYSPEVFQKVFDRFKGVKPQIYALYEGNPLLSAGYIKRTKHYFDMFYETINDPKAIKKYFVAGKTRN